MGMPLRFRFPIKNALPAAASRNRARDVWLTGLALTALCVALYVVHPPFVQSGSNLFYDAFMRSTHRLPQSDSIVLLDLDEESLRRHGQWPWPRWMLADLADAMLNAGAAVLAFDVLFPEPDRSSPAAIADTFLQRFGLSFPLDGIPGDFRDFDAFFSRSIRDRPVVLACEMIPAKPANNVAAHPENDGFENRVVVRCPPERLPAATMFSAGDAKQPIPVLGNGTHRGFINALPDADGTIRSTPLVWAWGDRRLYPSLALETYRIFRGEPCVSVVMDEDGIEEIRIGKTRVPTDVFGRMTLNYRSIGTNEHGFVSSFPSIPAHRVLVGDFDPELVRNRIVLVGTSAVGLKDVKNTPLTPLFSGMEIHAVALDNLLAGDMLRVPSSIQGWHAVLIALLGILLAFVGSRGNSRLSFSVFLLALAALPAGSLWLFSRHGLAFVPAWEILSMVIVYPVLTTLRFRREERQRKWVRTLFQTMVSDRVLLYLEQHPHGFSLSGCKMEATVLFSDLARFTTLSEHMPPDQVSRLLNHYHSPMTDIILQRDGYLDKYAGDLIMAVWGVPFATTDHARQACLAALEQQRKLAKLAPATRELFGCELSMRIGINTGEVTAGNMGSERRFQYTVVGDSVNLASRLEQAGKLYRIPILLGERTRRDAGDAIEARLLDRILVAGKSIPVHVYELIGEKGSMSPERAEFVRLYEQALQAYWQRQWPAARSAIEQARRLVPDDTPLDLLAQRIARCESSPPPADWNGVFHERPS